MDASVISPPIRGPIKNAMEQEALIFPRVSCFEIVVRSVPIALAIAMLPSMNPAMNLQIISNPNRPNEVVRLNILGLKREQEKSSTASICPKIPKRQLLI